MNITITETITQHRTIDLVLPQYRKDKYGAAAFIAEDGSIVKVYANGSSYASVTTIKPGDSLYNDNLADLITKMEQSNPDTFTQHYYNALAIMGITPKS